MLPHSPALTMLGAGLLWVGWFGFNGGSALTGSAAAASAILNTHTAACAAALVWIGIEAAHVGKPTSVGFATGAVAGLATVTPAAGMIAPGIAALFGVAGAGVCYAMIQLVKQRWKIDDSARRFCRAWCGRDDRIAGPVGRDEPGLAGLAMPPGRYGAPDRGADRRRWFTALWSAVISWVLAVGLGKLIPMRASEDDEREGLDITSHGERAWELD
jgi:Amt family ammonium transporter